MEAGAVGQTTDFKEGSRRLEWNLKKASTSKDMYILHKMILPPSQNNRRPFLPKESTFLTLTKYIQDNIIINSFEAKNVANIFYKPSQT